MCGVAAVVADPGSSVSDETLHRLQGALRHRGPDGCGIHIENPSSGRRRYGLVHTRLAILDLSDAAAQPMCDDEGQAVISYNGEIYNYLELADELRGLGHVLRSHGDTEVLLAAYRQWGTGCLQRLVGMFSFVLVDKRTQVALAARDPFGIKPLYYARTAEGWLLASEIKAIRAAQPAIRSADPTSVLRYLRYGGTDGGASTMFADIEQLPAGHVLTLPLDGSSPKSERYFSLDVQPLTAGDLSLSEAAQRLRDLLSWSIELHLRSDVAVGAALSGGLDSSSIVSLIPRLNPSAPLHCFTYGASGSRMDETAWAQLVAGAAGAEIHLTTPGVADLIQRLPEVTRSMDEPLPSTSTFAQYCVFELARSRGIKVLLDGQGADEMLAGYDRYVAARVASLLRAGRGRAAARLARSAGSRGLRRNEVLLRASEYFVPTWAEATARRMIGRSVVPVIADPRWFAQRSDRVPYPRTRRSRDQLRDRLAADLTEETLPSLLRYEDRNSMAWSIESRVPFLVPQLANFCLSLPEEYLVSPAGQSKFVLREAMRGVVPQPVLDRADKIGFAPPSDDWMRQTANLATQELRRAAEALPFIRPKRLAAEVARMRAGRALSEQLWRVIFLTMWADECGATFG